jgi:hypothetical protein
MYIEDLTQFPPGHPPSPYNFPIFLKKGDRWGQGVLPEGLVLCAVGWLGDAVPSEGETSLECITRLWDSYKPELILSDGSAGFHNCELCHGEDEWYPDGDAGPIVRWRGRRLRVYGHGHFLIRYNETVYLSPALILHYILDHGYKPPDAFIEAVCQGEFLALNDLKWIDDETSHR